MTPARLPIAPGPGAAPFWTVAQGLGVMALGALVAGLWLVPEKATPLFWQGIVPLIPLLVLLHPTIWRNVCPLATLSIRRDPPLPERGFPAPGPESGEPFSVWRPALLLLVLVALRPLGLDESGPASATLLMGLGSAAVWGRRHRRKAGFCNRHCPVLAVERLYGQAPLLGVGNARCDGCSGCTSRGCLDLSPSAASAQMLGRRRRRGGWLWTPLGAFSAVFPGIVFAFYTLPTDPSVLEVVGRFAAYGAASGLAAVAMVRATGLSWRNGFRLLAGISAASYLGFALPRAAEVWGWPVGAPFLRIAGVTLVGVWLLRGRGPGARVV